MPSHKKELKIRKPKNRLKYINDNRESDICPLCNKPIKKSTCPHSISEINQWWKIQETKVMVEL